MRFLNQLRLIWLGFSLRGRKPVAASEALSRYLTVKNWVDRAKNRVKASAFMPGRDGCTSVYRKLGADDAKLWRIGAFVAAGSHKGVLHGMAVIAASDVQAVGLALKLGWLPSLHVDITSWPSKDEQKLIAELLAAKASLVATPTTTR
jgi:hypothetical protein